MKYTLKLKNKKEIARKTWLFSFEKPKSFSFNPGQAMRLTKSGTDEGRTFTIVSAPHEENLVFAMRMRSSSRFKKYLGDLNVGDTVEAEGPTGQRFVLHGDTSIPAVFIAGGIGITPFHSILSHIAHEKLPYNITLFYSNRRQGDMALFDEISVFGKEIEGLVVVPILTKDKNIDLEYGEYGRLDETMLRKYVSNVMTPLFYIAGSPPMVMGVKNTLEKAGVQEDRILTKKFSGYES